MTKIKVQEAAKELENGAGRLLGKLDDTLKVMQEHLQALRVLDENAADLQQMQPDLPEAERRLAELYAQRITQLQDFFRLAQLLLMSLLDHAEDQPNISDIKGIDFD